MTTADVSASLGAEDGRLVLTVTDNGPGLPPGGPAREGIGLANTRAREAAEQVERQVARMTRYYADLRAELEEQVERAQSRGRCRS